MKKMLFMLILILCISSNASGYVMGGGAAGCGQMINNSTDTNYRNWDTLWLQGYISALNTAYAGSKFADADSIYYETLRICKENPLLKVWEAANKTYINLKNKNY